MIGYWSKRVYAYVFWDKVKHIDNLSSIIIIYPINIFTGSINYMIFCINVIKKYDDAKMTWQATLLNKHM